MAIEKRNPGRFFGLDPAMTLGVLDGCGELPPRLPGWNVFGVAGRGGFGTVWRASRECDGATAAIKIATADDPDTLERIEEETDALRSLNHPHIVSLLDSGPFDGPDGGLFLAMEFIDGIGLSQEIPAGGLPLESAFPWFRQICSAIIHAHEAGILHRDLKPANILIDSDGQAKVADFGLALPVHRRVHQLSLTRAGMVAGTAEYLPPEAYLQDYHPSAATDVFALGVILHEMLAGTPPRGAWPPVSNSRQVDIRIDALIRRALDPDPPRRWSSVREMRNAFEEIATSPPRYAGAPLMTLPIRVADFLWSFTGLFVLIASASSLLNLRDSSFSLPLDLVGTHSNLIGGYHAVFVLLQPTAALGVWQLLRLWRFRHVPMREALPSPFGLRLGHGRVAAALVFLSQMFFIWLPAVHLAVIFFESCSTWLRPGDPAMYPGLAVVCWKDGSMVSPWIYPEPGRGFWLQDRFGPPDHPLSHVMDQIGFTPLLFPLIMVVAGFAILAALVSTLGVVARSWWLRGNRILTLLPGLMAVGAASLFAKPAARLLHPPSSAVLMVEKSGWVSGRMTSHMRKFAEFLLGARGEILPRPPLSHWADYYAETVDYRSHGNVAGSDIERLWQEAGLRAERIEVSIVDAIPEWSIKTGRFKVTTSAIETCDGKQPGGASEISECVLTLSGVIHQDGRTEIRREKFRRRPLYQNLPRHASFAEAVAWAESLKDATRLSTSDPEASAMALGTLFHPLQISVDQRIERWIRSTPAPDSGLAAMLRARLPSVGPEDMSISKTLPGGRTRVVLRLNPSSPELPEWLSADLIHHAGVFKCVRLDTSNGS